MFPDQCGKGVGKFGKPFFPFQVADVEDHLCAGGKPRLLPGKRLVCGAEDVPVDAVFEDEKLLLIAADGDKLLPQGAAYAFHVACARDHLSRAFGEKRVSH